MRKLPALRVFSTAPLLLTRLAFFVMLWSLVTPTGARTDETDIPPELQGRLIELVMPEGHFRIDGLDPDFDAELLSLVPGGDNELILAVTDAEQMRDFSEADDALPDLRLGRVGLIYGDSFFLAGPHSQEEFDAARDDLRAHLKNHKTYLAWADVQASLNELSDGQAEPVNALDITGDFEFLADDSRSFCYYMPYEASAAGGAVSGHVATAILYVKGRVLSMAYSDLRGRPDSGAEVKRIMTAWLNAFMAANQ